MNAKFPRIAHLPWSPGATDDDKRLETVDQFLGRSVIITEKLDGANVCLTADELYARSHSGPAKGAMFNRLKALHAQRAPMIPLHLSVFCEWCLYVHSVEYDFKGREHPGLPLFVIGVRDDQTGAWFGWSEMEKFAERIDLDTVPFATVIQTESAFELQKAIELVAATPSSFGRRREGVVLRVPEPVADENFGKFTAKYVNEGFKAGEQLGEYQEQLWE